MHGGESISRGLLAAVIALAPTLAGCGYTLRPPYSANIKTVYVPIARSVTFRQDLNVRLTEEVIKRIERRTPYKVVGSPEGADARLEMRVLIDDKNLLVENPQNLSRHLIATMLVEARFLPNTASRASDDILPVQIQDQAYFNPEIGETSLAAFEKVISGISDQIVDMMEDPWDAGPGVDPPPSSRWGILNR